MPTTGTTITLVGAGNTAYGTAAAAAIATTNFLTETIRVRYNSAAAINSQAGTRNNTALVTRGSAAGRGGFRYVAVFGLSVPQSGWTGFIGLSGTAGALSATVEPSTYNDSLGVAWDSSQTTLRIGTRDGAARTATDLGASFPANSADAVYRLTLTCAGAGANVTYTVDRLDVAATASGTLSTNLPASTALLAPQLMTNTRAGAVAVGVDVLHWGCERYEGAF
jgi:hypothetical protein